MDVMLELQNKNDYLLRCIVTLEKTIGSMAETMLMAEEVLDKEGTLQTGHEDSLLLSQACDVLLMYSNLANWEPLDDSMEFVGRAKDRPYLPAAIMCGKLIKAHSILGVNVLEGGS